jgi:hypothetical protein
MSIEIKPRQPKKCRGCIWGNWDGLKQYCSKIKCIKLYENYSEIKSKKFFNPRFFVLLGCLFLWSISDGGSRENVRFLRDYAEIYFFPSANIHNNLHGIDI